MPTQPSPTRPAREEDFRQGVRWVHPQTCLEYEDFGAYLCGEEPLDHWRNRQIKRQDFIARTKGEAYRLRTAKEILRTCGREGPYSALKSDAPAR